MDNLSELIQVKKFDFEVLDEFIELDKWDDFSTGIEILNSDMLKSSKSKQGIIESTCIEGNMGGLLLLNIKAGKMEMHSHEYEHVGLVLEGSFSFVHEGGEVTLKAGDIYRILPNVPHGICCPDHAITIQSCT